MGRNAKRRRDEKSWPTIEVEGRAVSAFVCRRVDETKVTIGGPATIAEHERRRAVLWLEEQLPDLIADRDAEVRQS